MNSSTSADRQRLYSDMAPHHLSPLWEVLHSLVPPKPNSPCAPALWKYTDVYPYLMRAGDLVTAHEAVRRVLILENPAMRGQSCITQSLFAGLQMILPGEVAPSHRHTQSALRFIVQGSGAFTTVDGERTTMHEGDFIITPSMTWHDHGNPSGQPMIWLDGLDIPLIRFLDAGFAENDTRQAQEVMRSEGASFARFGHNMAPITHSRPYGKTSPIFSYPYARTREALDELERHAPIDAWDGVKLRYINPQTGGYPMPTMATFMQRLPPGFEGKAQRQTDGAVFSVVEGSGRALIHHGDATLSYDFGPRDHFVVPSWCRLQLQSPAGCVLFSFSDRPVQEALGIHREERLP